MRSLQALHKPYITLHILKTLIAILIGFAVMKIDHQPHRLWILISIIVVMMTSHSIGVHIERSVLRIIGTMIGAICGVGVILLPHLWIIQFIALAVVGLLLLTLGELKPRWRYGVILCLITFILVIGTVNPTPGMALERATDIIIGVLIALMVSVLIRPVSSSKVIEAAFKANWASLAKVASLIFSQERDQNTHRQLAMVELEIKKRLALQRETLDAIDLKGQRMKRSRLQRRYFLQSAVQRYLSIIETVLRRYYMEEGEARVVFTDWQQVGQAMIACLEALSEGQMSKKEQDVYQQSISALDQETIKLMNTTQDSMDAVSTVRFSLYRIGVVFRLLSH